MRALGRLALAAALIVPVGAVGFQPLRQVQRPIRITQRARATSGIKSETSNNGVGDHGGLLYTRKGSQKFVISGKGTCTGGIVTSVSIKESVTTTDRVELPEHQRNDARWQRQADLEHRDGHVGHRRPFQRSEHRRLTTHQTAKVHGAVSNAGSTNDTFKGNTVKIGITGLNNGLLAKASGGACQATIPLTSFSGNFSLSI